MREIAKVRKTEAGMHGLMDRLASAVVATSERIKTFETGTTKNDHKEDKTSDQLASMTTMMSRMMERMEKLEVGDTGSHSMKPAPAVITPTKEINKHWYGVGHGRDGPKIYSDWGITALVVNGYSGTVYQRFGTLEAAQHFMDSYGGSEKEAAPTTMYAVFNMNTGLKGIYYGWKEALDAFNGIRGAKAKKFGNLEDAQDWLSLQQECYDERRERNPKKGMDNEHTDRVGSLAAEHKANSVPSVVEARANYQTGPPKMLLGADPSLKSGEEAYGVDISTGET
jgi:hypothetical protein